MSVTVTFLILKNVRLGDCPELLTHSDSDLAGGWQGGRADGADGGGEEEPAESGQSAGHAGRQTVCE